MLAALSARILLQPGTIFQDFRDSEHVEPAVRRAFPVLPGRLRLAAGRYVPSVRAPAESLDVVESAGRRTPALVCQRFLRGETAVQDPGDAADTKETIDDMRPAADL